jgi:hypothetical protein
MSVFGFIENFFFISLGIVFALILLLVYHFKNRMAVAEKKSESMYGLLSAVVREIKSLRGLFGLSGGDAAPAMKDQPYQIPPKTVPEVIVDAMDSARNTSRGKDAELGAEDLSSIVESSRVEQNGLPNEVITLDLSEFATITSDGVAIERRSPNAASQKIVVSDYESDDAESESDDDDDEEESDDDSEDDELSHDLEEVESDDDSEEDEDAELPPVLEEVDLSALEPVGETPIEETPVGETQAVADSDLVESSPASEPVAVTEEEASVSVAAATPPIDQLRKMNINQLKTIAIQSGITSDTSKLKKHELIALIHSH